MTLKGSARLLDPDPAMIDDEDGFGLTVSVSDEVNYYQGGGFSKDIIKDIRKSSRATLSGLVPGTYIVWGDSGIRLKNPCSDGNLYEIVKQPDLMTVSVQPGKTSNVTFIYQKTSEPCQ